MNPFYLRFFLVLILSVILCSDVIYSQRKNEVRGIVVDSTTAKPIEFVNISIANSKFGTTTDNQGKFVLHTYGSSKIKLIITHINYFRKEITLTDSLSNNAIIVLLHSKIRKMEDVIVSATLSEKPLGKTTRSADVISCNRIEENFQSNMVDVLTNTPGFTQVWEYHSPLLLRGMNSNRLIVMKNGNRRIGTFPGGYFAQDINIYEAEKIEIIKGPGSVIYGSGAISGIINIISQEPFGGSLINAKVISGYGSNNNEFLEVAKVNLKREKFGLSINARYRKADDYVYGNGETARNSDVEDKDFSLDGGYKFSEKHNIVFHTDYHYGDWGKPRGFNGPTKSFTKVRNVEDGIHSALSYSYFPNSVVKSIKLNLFYDDGSRDYYKYKYSTVTGKKSTLDLVHYKDNYGGGRLYAVINPKDYFMVTTGVDGYIFMLDNPSENIDYYNNTSGIEDGYKNAGQACWGAFVNSECTISAKFMLTFGVRYDYAEVDEGENSKNTERQESRRALSGNVGMVFSMDENTHLSLNIGRAFRMPIAEELFTTVVSCKGTKQGNPELEPEYSWNFDLGFRGCANDNKLTYDFALFYDAINDYIGEAAETENEDVDYTYKNIDAKIGGGELAASYRFDDFLKCGNSIFTNFSASYQYGVELTGNGDDTPLFGIPPFKCMLGVKYYGFIDKYWMTSYFLKLGTEFAAEQNRVAAVPEGTDGGPWGYETSASHIVFDMSVGCNLKLLSCYTKVSAIAKNILDSDYKPFGSYIPAMGRNIKLMLSLQL